MGAKFVCARLNGGVCTTCTHTCSVEQFIADNPDVQAIHTVVPNGGRLACWNVWVKDVHFVVQTVKLPDDEEHFRQEEQAAVNMAVRVAAIAGMHDLTVTKAMPQFEHVVQQ